MEQNHVNNVEMVIDSKVSTTSDVVKIRGGKEKLLKKFPIVGTMVKKQGSEIIQKEIVNITEKKGTFLSITRAFEELPLNKNSVDFTQSPLEFDPGDIIYFDVTAKQLEEFVSEINRLDGEKMSKNDTSITKQGNTFNAPNKLIKADENGYLPSIDGRNVFNVKSKTENILITNLIPGETLSDGLYLFRKGNNSTNSSEENDKIYSTNNGEILGLYKGSTDGYSNISKNHIGNELEIYGNNIYGSTVQHSQNSINKIELKGYSVGDGVFDFGIYQFDGGGNLDTNNPVIEIKNIDFSNIPNSKDIFQISFPNTTVIPNTNYGFLLINSNGDINNKIILEGETKLTYSNTNTYTSYGGENTIANLYPKSGTYNIDYSLSLYDDNTNWAYFRIYNGSTLILDKKSDNGTWENISGTINNIPLGTYVRIALFNYGDAGVVKIKDISLTFNSNGGSLLKSNTGIGGVTTPTTGGLYNKLFSGNNIKHIDLINSGIYEHYEDLEENTVYRLTEQGELTTEIVSGSVQIGKTISKRKILLSI